MSSMKPKCCPFCSCSVEIAALHDVGAIMITGEHTKVCPLAHTDPIVYNSRIYTLGGVVSIWNRRVSQPP